MKRKARDLHAMLALQAKTTACGEAPPRGLVVDRDDKVDRFLSMGERCGRCAFKVQEHRARAKALHEINERKMAAARAAQQAAADAVALGLAVKRAEQAKAARARSIDQYSTRARASSYQHPKRTS